MKKPANKWIVLSAFIVNVSIASVLARGAEAYGFLSGVNKTIATVLQTAIGVCAAMPAFYYVIFWDKRFRKYERSKNGACIHCNYDLRTHHPGDKCPECGTLIPAKDATIEDERKKI